MNNYYLDMAATTSVNHEVLETMIPYFTDKWQNPSSSYTESIQIRKEIDKARENIAFLIGAKPEEIYFTSGGSESNCWAIQGFCKAHKNPIVITTKIEHHSTLECVKDYPHILLDVDKNGLVDTKQLLKYLKYYKQEGANILVSIIVANNEIGTVQNMPLISSISHKYGATVHFDAVQFFPYCGLNPGLMGADMMSVSGHKLHAPKGIGFLYVKIGTEIKPIIYGSQEYGKRGGTENVPYIMGLAKAIELASQKWGRFRDTKIRDYMIGELENRFGCQLNGLDDRLESGDQWERLPNNINVTFPQIENSDGFIYLLSERGIKCSAGSACNEGSPDPSHVLAAIGLTTEEASKTIRFSIPPDLTKKDVNKILKEIEDILRITTNWRRDG